MNRAIWILLALLGMWIVTCYIVVNHRIKVQGDVPMKKVAMSIFVILASLVIVIRMGIETEQMLMIVAVVAEAGLYMGLKHGIDDEGAYMNGRLMKYQSMNYYHEEYTDGNGTKIRFNSNRRDFSLSFPKDKVELVKAYKDKHGVTPFESYREGYQQQMEQREQEKEQQRREKQNKK